MYSCYNMFMSNRSTQEKRGIEARGIEILCCGAKRHIRSNAAGIVSTFVEKEQNKKDDAPVLLFVREGGH